MTTCRCAGCARCSPPCRKVSQSGVRFADYCRACHHSHLCPRCGFNAIASSSVESFCSTCLSIRSSWCPCRGCNVHDGLCPKKTQTESKFQGYCKRCAKSWQCPTCGTILPDCPKGDLSHACPSCNTLSTTAQCLCKACDAHVPASAQCTGIGNVITAGYCSICAPAWQCSCRRFSCWHHRGQEQCSLYAPVRRNRSTYSHVVNICDKCSWQYCTCDDLQCQYHVGTLCGKHRHVGTPCHSCARSDCHSDV